MIRIYSPEEPTEQAQAADARNHARSGLERPLFLSPLLGVQKRTAGKSPATISEAY